MRFLLDANMPRAALRALIAAGHSATHVHDLEMGRASDDLIDRHAQSTGAILVTWDLDFADTRA
jgi:predicted nuclease of predicted toxin-antitoxin system